jgi:hypothetical protein
MGSRENVLSDADPLTSMDTQDHTHQKDWERVELAHKAASAAVRGEVSEEDLKKLGQRAPPPPARRPPPLGLVPPLPLPNNYYYY